MLDAAQNFEDAAKETQLGQNKDAYVYLFHFPCMYIYTQFNVRTYGRTYVYTYIYMHVRRPAPATGLGPEPSTHCILEVVLEREPGSGSIHFSAYGCIAPTRRLPCVASMTCAMCRSTQAASAAPFSRYAVFLFWCIIREKIKVEGASQSK